MCSPVGVADCCYSDRVLDSKDVRYQPNKWACGPTALYHALRCYGETIPPRRLLTLSAPSSCPCEGDPKDGRCEHQLQAAALELGYRLDHYVCDSPADLYATVRRFLDARAPLLACVEHGAHWVCVVRATSRHVWVCDSARDSAEVLQRWTWRQLAVALAYDLPPRFDIYALVVN